MSDERTEKATPHRKQQAREKGDVVRSRELAGAVGTLAGVIALGELGERWAATWARAYDMLLTLGAPREWDGGHLGQMLLTLRHVMVVLLEPLGLVFLFVSAAALAGGLAQGGGLQMTAELLKPDWQRINPVSNLKNIFSLRGLTRLGRTLIPAVVLLVLSIHRVEAEMRIPPMSVERLPDMFGTAYWILLDTAFVLFGWSAIDYLVEWRSWESRLKMSHEELREEYKQTEGNPQVRGKIKSLRRQMRRRRMKADVSRASVVITNPTHFAVALSFDFETMEPPRVLAKGRDLLAEQIKSDARWAGVPIVENPPLARSLYRHVEEGHAIPLDLYAAVAAILAWLYRRQVEERMKREAEARQRKAKKPAPKRAAVPVAMLPASPSAAPTNASSFKEKP